ncbi:MAG: fibronectin type III domain-containing protein, partial [Phycisphaerales bacterium]
YGRIDAAVAMALTPPPGADTTPPAAPTGLGATAGDGSVSLAWAASAEADLAGYRVYRSLDGVKFAEVTAGLLGVPTYADAGLVNGTTYTYVVRAQDTAGNVSGASAPVSATPSAGGSPVDLFVDGFESGNLTAGGWRRQNTDAYASTSAGFDGAWGAQLRRKTWIERSVSTFGMTDITVSYVRRTAGLENNESMVAEWWDGAAWRVLESTRDTAFASRTWSLPASAGNNSAFKVRFRIAANRDDETADIDGIVVTGTPTN